MRNAAMRRELLLLTILCAWATIASAQSVTNSGNTGVPENAVLHGSNLDNVQLNNGNLHIGIPLWSLKGRGLDTGYQLAYDTKGWQFNTVCDSYGDCTDRVAPEPGNTMILSMRGSLSYALTTKHELTNCQGVNYSTRRWFNIDTG